MDQWSDPRMAPWCCKRREERIGVSDKYPTVWGTLLWLFMEDVLKKV